MNLNSGYPLAYNEPYDRIFDKRGNLYDLAMKQYPAVRKNEFAALFYNTPLKSTEHIIDLPSGGGYLKNHIPANVTVDSWEISEGFAPSKDINYVNINRISQDIKNKYDRGACLASLHHTEDKVGFISQLATLLKKSGIINIADVAFESGVKDFLEIFVHENNAMGHRGDYLSFEKPLHLSGNIEILRQEMVTVPWNFKDSESCAEYCRLLFGLNGTTESYSIIHALDKYVGIEDLGSKGFNINWELMYIDLLVN